MPEGVATTHQTMCNVNLQCSGTYVDRLVLPLVILLISGDKTVQCGRKVDCLKFWMLWKSRGHSGMANHVDTSFQNAKLVSVTEI